MKKYILILLLFTVFLNAQTYQNPTFGTITEKTNLEDNSATKVKVQDANGKSGWVLRSNLLPTQLTYVTPEQYGAVGNGIADDKTPIQNAINSGKMVLFNGNYFTSGTIIISNKTTIYGNGKITINANAPILDIKANDVVIDGIRFEGNGRGTITDYATTRPLQDAINVFGNVGLTIIWKNIRISNVSAYNLGGSLLNIENNGSSGVHTGGVSITNSVADLCWSGYTFRNRAEYSTLSNVKAINCEYGAYILSANNPISNPTFEDNRTGLFLGTSSNTGHTAITGGSINHSLLKSIDIVNQGRGYIINGLEILFGDITISGSDAVQFFNCNFYTPNFSVTTSTNTTIQNCKFELTPTFTGMSDILFFGTKWITTPPTNFVDKNEQNFIVGENNSTTSIYKIRAGALTGTVGILSKTSDVSGGNRAGIFVAETGNRTAQFGVYENFAAAPFTSADGVYIRSNTSGTNFHISTNNAGTEARRFTVYSTGGISTGALADPGAGNITFSGKAAAGVAASANNELMRKGEVDAADALKLNINNPTATGTLTTPALTISTSPTASAGSYEYLTRNTTTGVTEKLASSVVALDANVIHKTGNEAGLSGEKSFNTGTGKQVTILDTNASTTASLTVTNTTSTQNAIYASTPSNGVAIVLSAPSGVTGSKYISGLENGVERFSVSQSGNVTGLAFIKTGGTADQALTANGGVMTILTGTASLDFPSTASNAESNLTITVTGAVVGDVVSLGAPVWAANTTYIAYVSAADTVTVRYRNMTVSAVDPASATFKVKVFK